MIRTGIALIAFTVFMIEFLMSVVASFFTIFKICMIRYHQRIQQTLDGINAIKEKRKNEL